MNIHSLSLLDKTVQVTPQVTWMLGGLLEREVTRDYPEWAAAMASLKVSEKVKIMPSDIDEKVLDEKQDLENKVLSGEFRWMQRTHRTDPEEGTCSIADSSMDDNSRNSGIETYSDRNSSSGSELSELAIHTLLVETRARDLDREVYQDPDSDRYLIPRERFFDNAADDL